MGSWFKEFTLSGLDLFFFITTVISLGFNLWQIFRDQYKYAPLKNSLLGLFNDLKSRQLRAHQRQLLITSVAGMAENIEAVRLEFYDFVDEMKQSLEQIREHVVAAICTLDPNASSQQIFRAAEFGLNEQEKNLREEQMRQFVQKAQGSSSENLGGAAVGRPQQLPDDSNGAATTHG